MEQRRSTRVPAKRARNATSSSRAMMSDDATTTRTTSCTIDHLPDELLEIVLLRFFEPGFILATVASVCKRWRAIIKRGVPCSLKLHAYVPRVCDPVLPLAAPGQQCAAFSGSLAASMQSVCRGRWKTFHSESSLCATALPRPQSKRIHTHRVHAHRVHAQSSLMRVRNHTGTPAKHVINTPRRHDHHAGGFRSCVCWRSWWRQSGRRCCERAATR